MIYQRKRAFLTKSGRAIVIQMDLFEIQGEQKKKFPGGYKFSWIAFDANNSKERVLFDSHPPKGAHFHIDSDEEGVPFRWKSIEDAEEFFLQKVAEKFGAII